MISDWLEGIPLPFDGILEEEAGGSAKKKRKVLLNGGLMGPMGYMNPAYPFVMGPVEDEEEEDPNP